MEFAQLDYLDKLKVIRRCEKLILQTELHKRRICVRCERKKHPKGFALVRGTKDRKKVCRSCENTLRVNRERLRKVKWQQVREARTVTPKRKKAEPTALRNPISYAPTLVRGNYGN